jgi:hypothetical protein
MLILCVSFELFFTCCRGVHLDHLLKLSKSLACRPLFRADIVQIILNYFEPLLVFCIC